MRRRWIWLAAGITAATFLRPFRVEVAGESMRPTLDPGDWLLATRRGSLRRGSVVVLRHPTRPLDLVKRIVALPAEAFDGRRLDTDEYGVVGDNAARSADGRTFGAVRRSGIEGVVRFRYWPRPGPVR